MQKSFQKNLIATNFIKNNSSQYPSLYSPEEANKELIFEQLLSTKIIKNAKSLDNAQKIQIEKKFQNCRLTRDPALPLVHVLDLFDDGFTHKRVLVDIFRLDPLWPGPPWVLLLGTSLNIKKCLISLDMALKGDITLSPVIFNQVPCIMLKRAESPEKQTRFLLTGRIGNCAKGSKLVALAEQATAAQCTKKDAFGIVNGHLVSEGELTRGHFENLYLEFGLEDAERHVFRVELFNVYNEQVPQDQAIAFIVPPLQNEFKLFSSGSVLRQICRSISQKKLILVRYFPTRKRYIEH